MKKNTLYIIVLLVLVAVAYYVYTTKGSKSSISNRLKDFAVEDTSSIDKIIISNKNGSVLKLTKTNGQWMANDTIKARKDMIRTLLETIKRVSIKSPVNKAMKDNVMKQLATGAVQVEIFVDGDLEKKYFVGGATQDGLGTFYLLDNSDEPIVAHIPGFDGYLTVRYNTNQEVWRDREVFRYFPQNIDIITIDYPNLKKESFSLRISGKDYISLTNGAGDTATGNINGEYLRNYLINYTDVQYENIANAKKIKLGEVLLPENLICTITVFDKSGTSKKVELFRRFFDGQNFIASGNENDLDQNRMFIRVNGKDVYNAQYNAFSKLIVRYSDFFTVPSK